MIRENNTLEWQETAEQKRMTQRRIIQRRERARRRKRKVWRIRGLLLLFGCLLFLGGVRRFRQNPIQRYAKANGISMDQYPEELLSLYERNNETETFVEEYPLKKEEEPEIDLSDLSSASEVPLLLQWDQRWGYREYGDGIIGKQCAAVHIVSVQILAGKGGKLLLVAVVGLFRRGNGARWDVFRRDVHTVTIGCL